jgi:putative membrane protein
MPLLYFKALHIIFIVTWFAGLFYIVRLFIYMMEARENASEPARTILLEQYKIMSKRLWYGITWPSAVLTLLMGLGLLFSFGYHHNMPRWLWIKLAFVVGLYIYHFACHHLFRKLQQDEPVWSSQKLRVWNEVATIFLIAIVFLVILRSALSMAYGILGLLLFSALLMLAIKVYKGLREGKKI